jgi:hypothetical protein
MVDLFAIRSSRSRITFQSQIPMRHQTPTLGHRHRTPHRPMARLTTAEVAVEVATVYLLIATRPTVCTATVRCSQCNERNRW